MNFNFLDPGNLIYTIFFFLVGICTLKTYGKTNKDNKVVFIFMVALYCLIAGLRSKWVGSDTNNYVYYFEYVRNMSNINIINEFSARDPIAMIIFKYLSAPFNSYTPVLMLIQILFCTLIAITYYKYSKNCILAFLVFVFLRYHFFLMSGIRQGFALCIILYSYKYIKDEKFIGYTICVLLASIFHFSAILCLFFYPFRNFVFYNKGYKLIFAIIITLVSSLYIPDVANIVFSDKTGYLDQTEKIGNLFSLITSVLVFGFVHFRIQKIHVTKEVNTLYNVTLVFFLLSILSFRLELAFREAMYFGFIIPILIPYLTNKVSLRVIFMVMVALYILTGVPISVNPYQFNWNEKYIEKEV